MPTQMMKLRGIMVANGLFVEIEGVDCRNAFKKNTQFTTLLNW